MLQPKDVLRADSTLNPDWLKVVPLAEAVKPKNYHEVLVDHYWAVTEDEQVVLTWRGSPQCNSNPRVAQFLLNMYPKCRVEKLAAVFIPVRR